MAERGLTMTKIVFALVTILGCSNLDWAKLQDAGAGGADQTSGSASRQKDTAKNKQPGEGGGVDTLTIGTWKLNEAKSKLATGLPKNSIVVYEETGDDVKVTVDGTDKDGKAAHNEWTGKVDGKDYPVTGDPNSDTRSLT